ncbi:MAG: hypothetical protein A2X94_17265 [Bdellovibrionales bacterium GWB1_55_8]|nr:MAG: hypothetical protein A2X94_17265 [Bdellovibrionales bacterium GWB1_55_8]
MIPDWKVEMDVRVPLDRVKNELIGKLHDSGFALIVSTTISPDEVSALSDERPVGRSIVVRAGYPREESSHYFTVRLPASLVRCTIVLQEKGAQRVHVELRRSGRHLDLHDPVLRGHVRVADEHLQRIASEFRTLSLEAESIPHSA